MIMLDNQIKKNIKMKKIIFSLVLMSFLPLVNADEIVVQPYNQTASWARYTPIVSDWVKVTDYYGCAAWSPDPSTVSAGQQFVQEAKGCKINQRRFVQERQVESVTQVVRNVGKPTIEENVLTDQVMTRNNVGTNTKECYFSNSMASTMGTYFRHQYSDGDKFKLKITWNGAEIATSVGAYDESVTKRVFEQNGYRYYLGNLASSNQPPFGYYEVCRDRGN